MPTFGFLRNLYLSEKPSIRVVMLKLVNRNCQKPPIGKQYYLLQTFATENTAVFSRRDTYETIVLSLLLGIFLLADIYEN